MTSTFTDDRMHVGKHAEKKVKRAVGDVIGYYKARLRNYSGQVVHTHVLLSPNNILYRRKLGRKQTHQAMHLPRIRGLAA